MFGCKVHKCETWNYLPHFALVHSSRKPHIVTQKSHARQYLHNCHCEFPTIFPQSSLTSVKLLNSVQNRMIVARLKSTATSSGSFCSCRCSMKFLGQGPAATNFQLTDAARWISSPCAKENQVFGFIAPCPLFVCAAVNQWPVTVSSLTWERFCAKSTWNFQLTA